MRLYKKNFNKTINYFRMNAPVIGTRIGCCMILRANAIKTIWPADRFRYIKRIN